MTQVTIESRLAYEVVDHHLRHPSGAPLLSSPSPNHGGPLEHPRALVIHYTGGRSFESAVETLCASPKGALGGHSAHVVIGRECDVAQLVRFDVQAWHAGVSEWMFEQDPRHVRHLNRCSIGIELDNPGKLQHRASGWRTWFGQPVGADDVVLDEQGQGWHAYPYAQIRAAYDLCEVLLAAYPTIEAVLGHSEIAPGRKVDPGAAFPLDRFRGALMGRR